LQSAHQGPPQIKAAKMHHKSCLDYLHVIIHTILKAGVSSNFSAEGQQSFTGGQNILN